MRSECDFSKGVRVKYAQQFRQGTNVVVLAPEVPEMFLDPAAVNDALKLLERSQNERAVEVGCRVYLWPLFADEVTMGKSLENRREMYPATLRFRSWSV
jgi:hypothetical protein